MGENWELGGMGKEGEEWGKAVARTGVEVLGLEKREEE